MKGTFAAAAMAVMATGANALHHRHADVHSMFAKHANETDAVCVPGCTTIWKTITGEATLVPHTKTAVPTKPAVVTYAKPSSSSSSSSSTPLTTSVWTPAPAPPTSTKVSTPKAPTSSKVIVPTTSQAPTTSAAPISTKVVVVVPLPTPEAHTCPTPGVYTFTATTVTLSSTTTVCVPQSTKVPAGTHTLGGVTTIVETATTVTCPYAKETTSGGVVTSVIDTTTYVCPSAGTYTIAPVTKSCSEETIIVYPVPTSYLPGTYTAPEQVVTVTETDFVYVCPYSSQGLPTTSAVVEQPTVKVVTYEAPVTTKAPAPSKTPVVVVETPESTSEVVEETTSAAPKPKASHAPKKANTSTPSGGLTGGNDHFGITYTPYQAENGDCKSSDAVSADIKGLKDSGFEIVRVYSTDCNTLETVGSACSEHGLQMIIGIFVKDTGCSYEVEDIKEQVDAIAAWADWSKVNLFVVGNEAIMNGFCSASELAELVTVVKSKCPEYTGPWTISETLNIWQQPEVASAICDVVDVTGANIHPYFNPEVSPDMAGDFVSGQLELLREICSGNDVINLECGWPTKGSCNGLACPGLDEQATAIKSIRDSCGDKTVFFSYEDDMWKAAGECGCEQSWGSKDCFSS
ncbi:hypothetical protein G7046_g4450 [Stylonectria norvegica]|nr:hypothetical protein G7046_g4450 [Stylonectria norvegica]